jgi:hypothetical protein
MKLDEMTLDIEQHVDVKAPIADVFKSVVHRMGEGNTRPDGQPMELMLEAWAGGRWYRDRGNGIGHFWGHVQAIKPPVLLELSGPMFMSYPALNHIEVRLEEISGGTRVTLRHRALGMLDPAHREGVKTGWGHILKLVSEDMAKAGAAQKA